MDQNREIKHYLLLALHRSEGPMTQDALNNACKHGLMPRPLESDVDAARHQLEEGNFIVGDKDDIEWTMWTLTGKGKLRAKQLD